MQLQARTLTILCAKKYLYQLKSHQVTDVQDILDTDNSLNRDSFVKALPFLKL